MEMPVSQDLSYDGKQSLLRKDRIRSEVRWVTPNDSKALANNKL